MAGAQGLRNGGQSVIERRVSGGIGAGRFQLLLALLEARLSGLLQLVELLTHGPAVLLRHGFKLIEQVSQLALAAGVGNAELVELDATAMDEPARALMKRFGLFGPPALLAFPAGSDATSPSAKAIGYMEPAALATRLAPALAP